MPGIPEPKSATPVNASQLETLAADLQDFVAKLQLAAKVARTQPDESLAIYNWASAITGVKALRSFISKADDSRSAAELGVPIKVGQLKPRSTAKKAGDKRVADATAQARAAAKDMRAEQKARRKKGDHH